MNRLDIVLIVWAESLYMIQAVRLSSRQPMTEMTVSLVVCVPRGDPVTYMTTEQALGVISA